MKKRDLFFLLFTFTLLFSQDIQLELANLDSTGGEYTVDILMNSNVDIAGYQFLMNGGILTNASGGLTIDNQFIVSSSELGVVLAFDFMGGVIPAGDGTLIQLTFSELTSSEMCINDPIFSDLTGDNYDVDTGDCLLTGLESNSPSIIILEPENGAIIIGDEVTVSLLTTDPENIGFHYHLYIDDGAVEMVYDNYFQLDNLDYGAHTMTVILAEESHSECTEASCSQTVSFTLQEPIPETVELSISGIDPISRSFQIFTNSSFPLFSFEFEVQGVNPVSISDGAIDEFEFITNIVGNSIDGVSFTNSLPSGENHFATIYYDNPISNEICIANAHFIDNNEFDMITTVNGCAEIIIPENEFYISDIPESGLSQLIYFSEEIDGLQPGDEIGIFDLSGITADGAECDFYTEGEVLVGSGLMLYDGISIVATGSVNMCDWGGFVTSGFNLGNPISIKVYRPSEMVEYETQNITFSNGSGTFTELFTEVTALTLVTEITNNPPLAIIDQESLITFRNIDFTLDGSNSTDDENIASYQWYLNGENLIGTGEILIYQLTSLGDYIITLVVTDNEGTIGSAISVISVENQLPTEVSLLYPNEDDMIVVEEYEEGTLTLEWTESIDLDNDELIYTLNLWKTDMIEEHNIEIELIETSFEAGFISEYIYLESHIDQNYSWNITVSDGFDEVESVTNTFLLFFGLETDNENLPNKFSLLQNYPNPFNPNTEIQFSLDISEKVSLDIFDLSGRHIIQLINSKKNMGQHFVEWNAIDKNGNIAPAGLYIYQLNSKSNGTIKKTMTLLK
jgi:hypothetical protein